MINRENIAIYPVINTETNETQSIVLVRKGLKPGFLETIIERAAEMTETSPREFIFREGRIPRERLREIGKLPEDKRASEVSSLVQAIPGNVETITVNRLPTQREELPKNFVVKKPTTQELSLIIAAQKNNQEAWMTMTMDMKKGKTKYELPLSSKVLEEQLRVLIANNPSEPLEDTEIRIQSPAKPIL